MSLESSHESFLPTPCENLLQGAMTEGNWSLREFYLGRESARGRKKVAVAGMRANGWWPLVV